MTERQILLRKISTYAFALTDLNLFLDTHPNDKQTLAKIKEYQEILRPLYNEFESKFGPLTLKGERMNHVAWVKNPWPWDLEELD